MNMKGGVAMVWGTKTPSVSVGLTWWVRAARGERRKRRIRDPRPSHPLRDRQMLQNLPPREGNTMMRDCCPSRLRPEIQIRRAGRRRAASDSALEFGNSPMH